MAVTVEEEEDFSKRNNCGLLVVVDETMQDNGGREPVLLLLLPTLLMEEENFGVTKPSEQLMIAAMATSVAAERGVDTMMLCYTYCMRSAP